MSLPIDLVIEPGGVEFRSLPNQGGRIGVVRVSRADIPRLVDYFTRRFELDSGLDDDHRLAAAIEVMSRRGEIKTQYVSNHRHVATYCRRAGVGYEWTFFDGRHWRTTGRCVPLFQTFEPSGFLRVLSADLDLPRDGAEPGGQDEDDDDRYPDNLGVHEEFSDPSAPYPGDVESAYSYSVSIDYDSLASLAELVETRLGVPGTSPLPERGRNVLADLAARGELGPHLAPGVNTQRIADRCRRAGGVARQDGKSRHHRILRHDMLTLMLVFDTGWGKPQVQFVERHGKEDLFARSTTYEVSAPLAEVPTLVRQLEERLGVSPVDGRFDDRLIACFDALAAQGYLDARLPHRGNRDVAAQWLAACGVDVEVAGFARTEHLLHAYRPNSDSVYDLILVMDRKTSDDQGICFSEEYEYYPQSGDAGCEYYYSVTTPYSSLEALCAHFEAEPGTGDLEDRLTDCLRQLVVAGELTPDLGIEEAAHRMTAHFQAAGVPVGTDFSQWFNTD